MCDEITWSFLFWLITCMTIVSLTYGTLFFLTGKSMLPDGNLFGLFWLIVTSYFLGWSLAYIPYLNIPPVFGMLLAGILFRANGYDIHDNIGISTTGKIRTICLTFIMLRAGLQLTTTAIKNHPLFLARLALIPCSIEFLTIGVVSRYILDYPWDWALLNG